MTTTLYNRARTGAVRFWKITVNGDAVITEFGQVGGASQMVTDYGTEKNIGKKNYMSAAEDAQNQASRMILKKKREGYSEDLGEDVREFYPFAERFLPSQLRFYKPQNTLGTHLKNMLSRGVAWAVRKYDGEMVVLVHHLEGHCDIYSSKMLRAHHQEEGAYVWGDRFPQLIEAIEKTPRGTILLAELVAGDDLSDRWQVAEVMKSLTPRALSLQQERGWLRAVVWDVAWWEEEQLIGVIEYRHRIDLTLLLCAESPDYTLIEPEIYMEGQYTTETGLLVLARENGWEGYVVVDPYDTYGDRGFTLRGKADRPVACGKLKPVFEDDFVAMWSPEEGVGSYGSGKYSGLLGAVELYQINKAGDLVYICACGNGFPAAFIQENSSPESWPKVLQVEYASRTYISDGDSSNALQFPCFVRVREDKTPEECVNPLL